MAVLIISSPVYNPYMSIFLSNYLMVEKISDKGLDILFINVHIAYFLFILLDCNVF